MTKTSLIVSITEYKKEGHYYNSHHHSFGGHYYHSHYHYFLVRIKNDKFGDITDLTDFANTNTIQNKLENYFKNLKTHLTPNDINMSDICTVEYVILGNDITKPSLTLDLNYNLCPYITLFEKNTTSKTLNTYIVPDDSIRIIPSNITTNFQQKPNFNEFKIKDLSDIVCKNTKELDLFYAKSDCPTPDDLIRATHLITILTKNNCVYKDYIPYEEPTYEPLSLNQALKILYEIKDIKI